MKEHFCWVDQNLDYTFSHWAFDIVINLIYTNFDFNGIYISIILITIIIGVTLFVLLSKKNKSPVISFFITLICLYIIKNAFVARSQIVSFLCFIIEIYCIEQFIDTNKKKYAITIIILSIIVANFHAATWPLVIILFMPYIVTGIYNIFESNYFYERKIIKLEKKILKLHIESNEKEKYKKEIKKYETICNKRIANKGGKYKNYKIIRKESYNLKNLIIILLMVSLTGLITPIHGTPYTYIINSMFGESNFENGLASIDYIVEMQPIIPITNIAFITFSIILFAFMIFLPSKIKMEHVFLVLGLYGMSLISVRYVRLLVLIGAYVINDLWVYTTNLLMEDDINSLEKFFVKASAIICLFVFTIIFTSNELIKSENDKYIEKNKYPVEAVEYIKKNIDCEKMRIYNSYENGSYLMLNNIPVFIDSRLDVYCSEFNDTDIFYDFVSVKSGNKHYDEIFVAVSRSISDLANGRYLGKNFESDAFGVKPFDVTIDAIFNKSM